MHCTRIVLVALSLACTPPATQPPDAAPPPAEAAPEPEAEAELPLHLMGAVDVGGGNSLRYFVVIEGGEKGLAGKISIPQQGGLGIELAGVEVTKEQVAFELAIVGAKWTGKLGGDAIECTFVQNDVSLPCTMQRVTAEEFAEAQKHKRPQDPKPPFPYDVEEVTYDNGEVKLAGTLTLPKGGPHAAVLMISGSGAQNRDEEILGHKPFWVLADQLSRNGIAVLRVDDRGVGGSTGFTDQITMMDFASDVQAGLAFLRKHQRVDPKKLGLLAHSEGGAVAFRVAAGDPKLAFVVSLAGPGVNGGDLVEEQVVAVLKASEVPPTMIEVVRKQQHEAIALLRKIKDPDKLKAELTKVMDPTGAGGPQVQAQIEVVMSPWFRTFVNYEPAKDLAKLRMPVLALNGTLDVQVVADQNVPPIEKALRRNKKAKVQRLDGLNHLFQHAKTGSPAEYGEIEETIDPAVLELVTKFVSDATR